MKSLAILLFAGAAALVPAHAAVTDVASNGFTIDLAAAVAAPPEKLYAVLVEPAHWWSSQHTFSGDAANLTLDPRAGGCFCEKLAASGSVQHLSVVFVQPARTLRLAGMLGPFQGIAGNGVLTFTLTKTNTGTDLRLTYQLAGYANAKLGGKGYEEMSVAADGMLSEQFARLKRAVETGSPEPKP